MEALFKAALGLEDPWYVKALDFSKEEKRLDIKIDFKKGSTFYYEDKKAGIRGTFPVHDTVTTRWRHLNFFEHECYLEARVPRVKTDNGKVRKVSVPWEGKKNGFTLLMEAVLLQFLQKMPVHDVAELFSISDYRLWSLIHAYVDVCVPEKDMKKIEKVGVDETSARKRHDYITIFVDLEEKSVAHIEEGKGKETIEGFAEVLKERGGSAEQIQEVSCDLSPAFTSGVKQHLPEAHITYDRFHVMKIVNEAVDNTRKWERRSTPALKKMRYILLSNRDNLTKKNREKLKNLELNNMHLETMRAYQLRENFQLIFEAKDLRTFIQALRKWCVAAEQSGIFHMEKAAKTIRKHWRGIARWKKSQITNGILEGFNSLIQAAKAKARGYSTKRNLIAIVYLMLGKLNFRSVNACCQPT